MRRITRSDPEGTDWVDVTSDVFAGWGDALTMGLTKYGRYYAGKLAGVGDANAAVNYHSPAYTVGTMVGVANSIAVGGAEGEALNTLKSGMSRVNAVFPKGAEFVENSHWIPKRMLPDSLQDAAVNIKKMWGSDHALADPYRYRFMPKSWKAANPLPNTAIQQINRMPGWFQGGAIGAAYSAASRAAESKGN